MTPDIQNGWSPKVYFFTKMWTVPIFFFLSSPTHHCLGTCAVHSLFLAFKISVLKKVQEAVNNLYTCESLFTE